MTYFLLHPSYVFQDNIKSIFSYNLKSPINPEESTTEDVQEEFMKLVKRVYAIEAKDARKKVEKTIYKLLLSAENPIQISYMYKIIDNLQYIIR